MADISKETFKDFTLHNKLNALFDMHIASETRAEKRDSATNTRVNVLEKSKKRNTVIAGITGLFGGFMAVIAKTFTIG